MRLYDISYNSHSLGYATESMNIKMFALSVAQRSLMGFVNDRMFSLSDSPDSSLNLLNKKTARAGENFFRIPFRLMVSLRSTHQHVSAIIYESISESSVWGGLSE